MTAINWPRDARLVLLAQALRAFAYGFGAVLMGVTLRERHFSSAQVGLVLAAVVAGTALASLIIARYGDRFGRRRCYIGLYLLLALTGVVFAFTSELWLLIVIALAGALSTEVVESGPFTSLEQVMLVTSLSRGQRIRGLSTYNAVATASGGLGALAVGLPGLARALWHGAPSDATWFLLFVPVALAGAVAAATLSPAVETPRLRDHLPTPNLQRSRRTVRDLAGLFALDSLGGGFVVQAFIAYWLSLRFGASAAFLGALFFVIAVIQTASFVVASRLAERFGLLRTMVFTHLPSNVLTALVAVAPNLGIAVLILAARTALEKMDVPTRQAYVMAVIEPHERTAAAAYTNTARYITRPVGPALAGVAQSVTLGAPFIIAAAIKTVYDVGLWFRFSRVPLLDEPSGTSPRPEPAVLS